MKRVVKVNYGHEGSIPEDTIIIQIILYRFQPFNGIFNRPDLNVNSPMAPDHRGESVLAGSQAVAPGLDFALNPAAVWTGNSTQIGLSINTCRYPTHLAATPDSHRVNTVVSPDSDIGKSSGDFDQEF